MKKVEAASAKEKAFAPLDTDPEASVAKVIPKEFRLLKWNELVSRGDFVTNELEEFEPWEGPAGFRADSFVKAIYRRLKRQTAGAKKAA
jgi:hypothetical protein